MASAPKSSKTESAASLPIAASQLIELSKRDAVGERSIAGPKKLSNGTAPGLPARVDRREPVLRRGREVAVAHAAAGVAAGTCGRPSPARRRAARSSATGSAPTSCEPSTKTIAPTARAIALIAAMSERWPVAVCTPLKATSRVPPSTRSRDVVGLEPAVAERHLPDVVALAGELPPREVVRAVLALPDDDVLARGRRAELGGDQTGRRRHRRDQRDVGGVGADQPRHRRSCRAGGPLAADVVEAVGLSTRRRARGRRRRAGGWPARPRRC